MERRPNLRNHQHRVKEQHETRCSPAEPFEQREVRDSGPKSCPSRGSRLGNPFTLVAKVERRSSPAKKTKGKPRLPFSSPNNCLPRVASSASLSSIPFAFYFSRESIT